jgi:putative ATP-dependent endonuclease of the OLD family
MLLKKLSISNFRCYAELPNIPIHKLTVFIGENDAGKTALLDAIQILLTSDRPKPEHYRRINDEEIAETIEITGLFKLEDRDKIPDNFCSLNRKEFTLIKKFTQSSIKCEVLGLGFSDERFNIFGKQDASTQKELLNNLGIAPENNAHKRISQFEEAINIGKINRQESLIETNFSTIVEYLPRFQRTSSIDYKQPDSIVRQTLRLAVDNCLHINDKDTGERKLIPELLKVKNMIKEALNNEVGRIQELLHRENPKLLSVEVNPKIEFPNSVTETSLMIDIGEGLQLVSAFGDGTRKKLWMGLLNWERQVQKQSQDISIFQVYDEPDTNLDYESERRLFTNILDITNTENSGIQSVICTHAVTMIDRAPAESINLIRVEQNGTRTIEYLDSNENLDLRDFLSTVGRSVGITNSALFYERAFLIVEGESEENALPILYYNLYKRSLIEDGIVLVCLHTCGAWRSVLQVFQRHKSHITVMLLDQDCTTSDANSITSKRLEDIGYPPAFLTFNCFYIGQKEFEDAFLTNDIVSVLNHHYPREDSSIWSSDHVDVLRSEEKFSEALRKCVHLCGEKKCRSEMSKPNIAKKIAEQCVTEEQIPEKIREAFVKIRTISGCETCTPEA